MIGRRNPKRQGEEADTERKKKKKREEREKRGDRDWKATPCKRVWRLSVILLRV